VASGARAAQGGTSRWQAGVFWALITDVLLAPLPFGGDRPLPASLLCLAVGALVLVWGLAGSIAARGPAVPLKPLLPAGVLFAAAVAWIAAQGLSFTPGLLHHPYWARARTVLEVPVAGAIAQEMIDLLAIANALRAAIPPRVLSDYRPH